MRQRLGRSAAHFIAAGAAAFGLAAAAPLFAQSPPSTERAAFDRDLGTVKVLNESLRRLNRSEATANAIDERIRKAESSYGRSPSEARVVLDEGYALVKSALREYAAQQRTGQPEAAAGVQRSTAFDQRAEFDRRMDSARALQAALARIAGEKQDSLAMAAAEGAERLLQDADAAARRGEWPSARAQISVAAERTRTQIERLRGGETLVRSLHFATKEEEYRYELDRNDTFRMLVKLLVPDSADARMTGFLDNAAALRRTAEGEAASGDHDSAVKSLERSTGEILKVIRNAGLLIPG